MTDPKPIDPDRLALARSYVAGDPGCAPATRGLVAELLAELDRLEAEAHELRAKVKRQRHEIRHAQIGAERRNLELDALGKVWCSGGCEGGMMRFSDAEPTEDMIADIVANAARARAWWINRQGKGKADYEERFARASEQLRRLVGDRLAEGNARLQAELDRLRSKTRVTDDDFAARGVGRAQVEAWLERSSDWTRMDDGSVPDMSSWQNARGTWAFPGDEGRWLVDSVTSIAGGKCDRAWALLDEMAGLEVP